MKNGIEPSPFASLATAYQNVMATVNGVGKPYASCMARRQHEATKLQNLLLDVDAYMRSADDVFVLMELQV